LLTACAPATRNVEHNFYTFGTYVSVTLYGVSDDENRAAIRQLDALFASVNENWYPWAPGELQRVNAAIAAGESISVSPALKSLLLAATDYEQLSDGRFNAGLGRLTELWKLHDNANLPTRLPDSERLAALLAAAPSLQSLTWDGEVLSSQNPEFMIDLGGIAKGAILRNCQRLLLAAGVENAIVNIGGDLLVMGEVDGRAARIGIRSPLQEAPVAGLDVASGEAVFTSGTYERFVEIDGKRYAHILDPATGLPVEHTVSVTVVDADPTRADAAATALLVGGTAEFDQLVDALQIEYALLIDVSGDTRLTPAMAQRLHWIEGADAQ